MESEMSGKLVTKFTEIAHGSTLLFIHSFCPTIWNKEQELRQSLKEHLNVCVSLNLHSVTAHLCRHVKLGSGLEKVRGV